jgi:hypothetical protein
MSTYPVTIRRCQHIKVNGIQCGSPAVRNERHCYFHEQCRLMSREINMKFTEHGIIKLPTLEDANSIQLGLAEVMRLLVTNQIDHRTASLLLRALRTAAANVKFTSFEPKPTHVVIDPKSVENRPLGATAWSTVEGQEYDTVENTDADTDKLENEGREPEDESMRRIAGGARNSAFPDKPDKYCFPTEPQEDLSRADRTHRQEAQACEAACQPAAEVLTEKPAPLWWEKRMPQAVSDEVRSG